VARGMGKPCVSGVEGLDINYDLKEARVGNVVIKEGDIITLDGLRVEYKDGFGLMRASNTTPAIVLRFEADDDAALKRIQEDFREVLREAAPGLTLPF